MINEAVVQKNRIKTLYHHGKPIIIIIIIAYSYINKWWEQQVNLEEAVFALLS